MIYLWFFMIVSFTSSYEICGMQFWIDLFQKDRDSQLLSSADELLLQACLYSDEDQALSALDLGAHVNVKNEQGETPLYIAAEFNNTILALHLIKAKADVNILGPEGDPPLIKALEHKNRILLKALLEAGAKVNIRGFKGIPPLIIALELRDKNIIKLLLSKADSTLRCLDGTSSLDKALELGASDIVMMLLEAGVKEKLREAKAKKSKEKDESRFEPLVTAIYYRLAYRVTRIVATVDIYDFENAGLLLRALHSKVVEEVVLQLLPYEYDLNAQDEHGDTALLLALKKRFVRTAKTLLLEGVSINKANKDGWTPLLTALYYGCSEIASLFLLLDEDICLNRANVHGFTPFLAAVYAAQESLALKLIDKGAEFEIAGIPVPDCIATDVTRPFLVPEKDDRQVLGNLSSGLQNDLQVSPFLLAVEYGLERVVAKLLEKNVDSNKILKDGRTALHIASAHGKIYILELLLKSGKLEINKQDKEGWTALHYAAEDDRKDCAQLLIAYNADKKARDAEGKTAYDKAVENKYLSSEYLKPEDTHEPCLVLKYPSENK